MLPNPTLTALLREQWTYTLRLTVQAFLAALTGTWLALTCPPVRADQTEEVKLPW